MRGHVRRRGKGWVYVLDADRDENGKRKQRWSRQHATKSEAEQELRKALGRLDQGDDPIPERVTVAELAAAWYAHMAAQNKPRPNIRQGYRRHVDAHVLPMLGGVEARKVRPADVQRVLDRYVDGRSPRTVARLRAVCSSMFAYALRMGIVQVNPTSATSTPTASKPRLRVPEPDEVRAIVDAAQGTPYAVPIALAAWTGMRRSEVLGVTWSSVDLDAGTVRVERTLQRVGVDLVLDETTKTSHAARSIPLTADTVALLRQVKADQARRRLASGGAWADHDLVCERGDGRPVEPDLLSTNFARVARRAGVDGVRLHDLRHAFATRLARSGLHPTETAAILGHASASFTLNTYQHVTAESAERTRVAIEGAFGS